MNARLAILCAFAATAALAEQEQWLALMNQGDGFERAAKYADALEKYQQALRLAETFPPGDEHVPASLTSLANTLDDLGRSAEAERYYKQSLKMVVAKMGVHNTPHAVLAVNLAAHYYEHGDPHSAEPLLRGAIATLSELESPDDVRLALARNCLAGVLISRKAYAEADQLMVLALASFDKHPETWRFRKAVAMNNLGVLRRFQGRNEEGIRMIEESLALSESMMGPDHPMLLSEIANLASAYQETHRLDEAEALFRRAVDIAEKRLGPEHPEYAHALSNYAKYLRKTGRKSEAKPLETRAGAILRDSNRTNGKGMTVDVSSFR